MSMLRRTHPLAILWRALLLLTFASPPAGPLAAQDLPPPIGEEAFKILSAIYEYDSSIPLDARVVDLKEEDEGTLRKIVFRSSRGFLVPGLLQFPKTGQAPYPCVLLAHGWSGSKDNWWKEGNIVRGSESREALLKRGYAVFAIDAQGHGDRIAENEYQVVNVYNEPGAPVRKNFFTVREVISQTLVDYRRALDVLAARGDIDMARIGIWGYSMGGFHAIALTAMDPRIKLAVSCVVPTCWSKDPILAPANYVQGLHGRPVAMLMGREDELCPLPQAEALYAMIQGPATKLVLYNAGHGLPESYVKDAIAFVEAGL